MFQRLAEHVLPALVGYKLHNKPLLDTVERTVLNDAVRQLPRVSSERGTPVIVAMVGLVGSGKSTVAREIARRINGTVIEADEIRTMLRQYRHGYDHVWLIAELLALTVLRRGGNPVLDSDFIDRYKRASLRQRAEAAGVRLALVRTHCHPHITIGRAGSASYPADSFMGGASSPWKGEGFATGAVVKIGEWERRRPNHYDWSPKGGGTYTLKRLPFAPDADIDTSEPEGWRQPVDAFATSLGY